jgi:hypothetical protein
LRYASTNRERQTVLGTPRTKRHMCAKRASATTLKLVKPHAYMLFGGWTKQRD